MSRVIRHRSTIAKFSWFGLVILFFAVAMADAAEIKPSTSKNYHIGLNDVLMIDVYDNKDISGKYTVNPEGLITFPLIKEVKLLGLSVEQAQNLIAKLLEKDYIYDPIVSIDVVEYRSKQVKVLGYVKKPGVYYLDGPVHLFEMLSKAEGLLGKQEEIVKGQMIEILRQGDNGQKLTRSINLYKLIVEGDTHQDIALQDGDVVTIPVLAKKIHVVGEVKLPGTFTLTNGMTVGQAVAMAHGATSKGDMDSVIVRRIIDGKETEVEVRLDDEVQPDDIVEVPLSFW